MFSLGRDLYFWYMWLQKHLRCQWIQSWSLDFSTTFFFFHIRCSPDDGHTPNCTDDEKHMIQSNAYCGLITDPNGPFQKCHSVVDPQSYFEDCQYDLCELHLDNAALCESLQAYADACQSAGVQLAPWRNATFCRMYQRLQEITTCQGGFMRISL